MNLRRLSMICVFCAVAALVLRSRFHDGGKPDPAFVQAAAERSAQARTSRIPAKDRRSSEFTYLTIPEWYLVWSPQEYAEFLKAGKPASDFPFLGHLEQFWQGYGVVREQTQYYPFNMDYHEMIWVIGASTTVEYGLKWTYEKMVGRVSEATVRGNMTEEDRICAQTADEYIDFIFVEPWYKFDFMKPLGTVWATDWWGPNPIRSWERKYLLTSEYLVKGAYGWVIKKASESVYDGEQDVTVVVLDRLPKAVREELPKVQVLKEFDDGAVLAQVPRYQAFTPHALLLAKSGINFLEIAGNKDAILVSAIVPDDHDDSAGPRPILTEQILTQPGRRRIIVSVPVPELAELLRRYDRDRQRVRLEHVYDY
jgi:hypothetical protein